MVGKLPPGTEAELLEEAIQAARREAGLDFHILQVEIPIGRHRIDALLRLEPGGITLHAEVKKWAQHVNFGALLQQLRTLPEPALLVADYVNPNMAGRLRDAGIAFIDTAGNAYIHEGQIHVYLVGKKPPAHRLPAKKTANRAFEPKGLQLLFILLTRPELLDAPYREIARAAGVAVGTVGWVMTALKAGNYLHDKGRAGGRVLLNRARLVEQWVEAWPLKLKPRLALGNFVADDPHWWHRFDLETLDACWGGEIAAEKYTRYLKPRDVTVYIDPARRRELLAAARLRVAAEWDNAKPNVFVFEKFWQAGTTDPRYDRDLAHPLLVYADLVAAGDPRTLETAAQLKEQYLAGYFRED